MEHDTEELWVKVKSLSFQEPLQELQFQLILRILDNRN